MSWISYLSTRRPLHGSTVFVSLEKRLNNGDIVLRTRTKGKDIPPDCLKVKLLQKRPEGTVAVWKLFTMKEYLLAGARMVPKKK